MLNNIITFKNPKSSASESFRTLRTNIQFSSVDDSLESLIITSSGPSEGKSSTLLNLAVTMAQSGKKVIILDCDLRKPSMHKKIGLHNHHGMTNILVQDKTVDECIKETGVKNLYAITSGPVPPNPSELLASNRMKNVLNELKKVFDIVLVDAPPVLAVTDAQILAKICDGVLILACYGKTEKDALKKAKDLIDKAGGRILGIVLNEVPYKSNHYYGKYYGEYYGEK